MAKFLNKDQKAYNAEKDRFINEVRHFHDSKG
jgi:hypothetical protein